MERGLESRVASRESRGGAGASIQAVIARARSARGNPAAKLGRNSVPGWNRIATGASPPRDDFDVI
jgi:hypothetical protein